MILNLEPYARRAAARSSAKRFTVTPEVQSEPHQAAETGNLYRRLVLPPGDFSIRYEGEIEMTPTVRDPHVIGEMPIRDLPLDVLPYLYPIRYCQSDKLGRFAWRQFGEMAPGHDRVTAICNWIYEYVDYLGGLERQLRPRPMTPSRMRAGVCRDFAHLGVTFCRALGIPARFVSAYGWQLEPQDFHAVFEAYLGGRWYLFDATRLCPIDAIVRIGVGRDAADTSFATFYGQIEGGFKQVWVEPVGAADDNAAWTTEAVSVATV